ncbi:hypothetical protein K0B03_01190 [Patescibacteria group bacterium]|nr:hypothetical protein [Patescibacteria group bacterium]
MKKKIIKKTSNKKNNKNVDNNIFFKVILMIMIIPIFSFLTLSMFDSSENFSNNTKLDIQKIIVSTEKEHYKIGDQIILSVENHFEKSIYLEPCEYQDRFEKKINGSWQEITSYQKDKDYDKTGFKKEDSVKDCRVILSSKEAGVYRSVVRIFFDCKKPGEQECQKSELFYSNEFNVL